MAIDDPLDAAQGRVEAERRAESPLAPYARDLSDIVEALPIELAPVGISEAVAVGKAIRVGAARWLRRMEEERRRYLVEVLVDEFKWLRDRVSMLNADHVRFIREEFPGLVLAALQKAERSRASERIVRMARVLGQSARRGPSLTPDTVEELLRVSMDLDEDDVRVLGELVRGQREQFSPQSGSVNAEAANNYWGCGNASHFGGVERTPSAVLAIPDGHLRSHCAKLQAYGLIAQVPPNKTKVGPGVTPYAVLQKALDFVDAIQSSSEATH
ncbi:MAG: hypothetical protein ACLP6G_14195 [Terriglobales bacterium]